MRMVACTTQTAFDSPAYGKSSYPAADKACFEIQSITRITTNSRTRVPKHFQAKVFLRMITQAASLLCGFLTAACSAQPINDDSSYAANVGIVNHTAQYIHSASVNGAGGANMGAWGAGMGNVCCALVPTHWYPGMQVVVRWDVPEGSKHVYQEKRVEVERCDEPGSIYLHFFPNDQVRVVVSQFVGWSEMHPIRPPEKPAR